MMDTFWVLIWLYFLIFILVMWLVFAYLRKRHVPPACAQAGGDGGGDMGGIDGAQSGLHPAGHPQGGNGSRDNFVLGFASAINATGAAIANGSIPTLPKTNNPMPMSLPESEYVAVSKAYTPEGGGEEIKRPEEEGRGGVEEQPTLMSIPSDQKELQAAAVSVPTPIIDSISESKGLVPPPSAVTMTPGDHFVVGCTRPLRIGMTIPSDVDLNRFHRPRFEVYLIAISTSQPIMSTPLWRSEPLSGLSHDFELEIDTPRLPAGTALMVVLSEGADVLSTRVIHVDRSCCAQVTVTKLVFQAGTLDNLANSICNGPEIVLGLANTVPGQSDLLQADLFSLDTGKREWFQSGIVTDESPRWICPCPPQSLFKRGKPSYQFVLTRWQANGAHETLHRLNLSNT